MLSVPTKVKGWESPDTNQDRGIQVGHIRKLDVCPWVENTVVWFILDNHTKSGLASIFSIVQAAVIAPRLSRGRMGVHVCVCFLMDQMWANHEEGLLPCRQASEEEKQKGNTG